MRVIGKECMTSGQLRAIIPAGLLSGPVDSRAAPALVIDAREAAGCRYVEFFAGNIRNPYTRRTLSNATAVDDFSINEFSARTTCRAASIARAQVRMSS